MPLCGGLPTQADGPDFSQSARRADFKTFCEQFENNYAYLDRTEKPWKTWAARYADAVDAAATPQAFAAVLESALDELHDFHAEVRSRNPHRWLPVPTFADIWAESHGDDALVVAVRRGSDAERAGIVPGDRILQVNGTPLRTAAAERLTPAVDNQDRDAQKWAILSLLSGRADEERHLTVETHERKTRQIVLPVKRQSDREPGPLSFKILPDDIGYIRLHNSLGDQTTVAAFDAAPGILGRFVTQMLPYQRHRILNYGQPDVERNWLEMIAPRGPFPYSAPQEGVPRQNRETIVTVRVERYLSFEGH